MMLLYLVTLKSLGQSEMAHANAHRREDSQMSAVYLCLRTTLQSKAANLSAHTWEKPQKCQHCLYAREQLSSLKGHMRTHRKETSQMSTVFLYLRSTRQSEAAHGINNQAGHLHLVRWQIMKRNNSVLICFNRWKHTVSLRLSLLSKCSVINLGGRQQMVHEIYLY